MENQVVDKIRSLTSKLSETLLKPGLIEADENELFRKDIFTELASKGIMGLSLPREFGGSGLPPSAFLAAIQELSYFDPGMAVTISVHSGLCGGVIFRNASEELKKEWLPKIAKGSAIGAYSLTENHAGSDPSSMKTTATWDNGSWIVDGEKMWITSGSVADFSVLYANTIKNGENLGISAFLVPHDLKGVSSEKINGKLGMRTSDSSILVFDKVVIHESMMIGNPGKGLSIALEGLDYGRLGISAVSLGIHKAAFDSMVKYAKEREQFGKAIASFQLIQEMITDVAVNLESGLLLFEKAVKKLEDSKKFTKEAAIAKLFTSESAVTASDRCVQVHGGYGYSNEFPAERFYRDSRVLTIFEGTTEVHKLLIGRLLTGIDAFRN
tara:strand:- start:356 stop:1504 length:1149 start_codon:yes stop_codon:yes gene_type:complete